MKKEKDYFETEEGAFIRHQAKKIKIEGILCLALGLIYLVFNIYQKEKWYMYLVTLALFVFGSYFIYKANSIKIQKKNIYDFEMKNRKNKEL